VSPQELRNSPFVYVTLDFWPNDPEDMDRLASCTSAVGTSGGGTCHLAVTARGMGKPAVVGATSLRLDYGTRRVTLGTQAFEEVSLLALDGSTGEVWLGPDIPSLAEGLVPRMEALASIDWVEQIVAMVSAKEGFNSLTPSELIDLANLRRAIEGLRAQYD
jgi:phosphoenolpyruvate synthase/pyruvate phosphate dikinase